MKESAANIKTYRNSKGWSQEQLARQVGVSLNTVQRWESGKSIPSPLAMVRLKEIFYGEVKDQPRLL